MSLTNSRRKVNSDNSDDSNKKNQSNQFIKSYQIFKPWDGEILEEGVYEPPNIIKELTHNFELYYIDRKLKENDWIDILNLPISIETTFDRIRAKVNLKKKPGLRPLLHCCIMHGIEIIKLNEHIDCLYQAKEDFDTYGQLATPEEEFVSDFFKSTIKLDLEAGKRFNTPICEEVKNKLSDLSYRLCLQEWVTAILAIYAYLCTQDDVHKTYKDKMLTRLNSVYSMIQIKSKAARFMVDILYPQTKSVKGGERGEK